MESISSVLKFFLNALKALFLSPFYVVYFALFLAYSLLNFVFGGVRWILSGFSYGSLKENKYNNALIAKKGQLQQAKGRD